MAEHASDGAVGMNTVIELSDDASPEVWSEIPEPKDMDGPEVTSEFADATHMQSPAGFRERMPTVKSNSQVTFKCNKLYGNTVQDAMIAAANANPPTLKHFRLTYPDGDIITFYAYVGAKLSSPMVNMMEWAFTLSLKGAWVMT